MWILKVWVISSMGGGIELQDTEHFIELAFRRRQDCYAAGDTGFTPAADTRLIFTCIKEIVI